MKLPRPIIALIVRALFRPSRCPDLVRVGSAYGGWWVPESQLIAGSTAYCAGAGEDITFDMELFRRGLRVVVFDPTPRAIAFVAQNDPTHPRFVFVPEGWWHSTTMLRFFAPRNSDHVSHSVVNLQCTSEYFTAKVRSVRESAEQLGDQNVSIIKMDIEGAEFNVIDAMLTEGPLPNVLCVEFDAPRPFRRLKGYVGRLKIAGYELNKIDGYCFTFTRRDQQ